MKSWREKIIQDELQKRIDDATRLLIAKLMANLSTDDQKLIKDVEFPVTVTVTTSADAVIKSTLKSCKRRDKTSPSIISPDDMTKELEAVLRKDYIRTRPVKLGGKDYLIDELGILFTVDTNIITGKVSQGKIYWFTR